MTDIKIDLGGLPNPGDAAGFGLCVLGCLLQNLTASATDGGASDPDSETTETDQDPESEFARSVGEGESQPEDIGQAEEIEQPITDGPLSDDQVLFLVCIGNCWMASG